MNIKRIIEQLKRVYAPINMDVKFIKKYAKNMEKIYVYVLVSILH